MFAALALITVLVQPGNTLSGIAASHGISLAAVEAANPQFSANWNLIYAGQTVNIPGRHRLSREPGQDTPAPTAVSGYSSPDLADVPGVPRAFAACVALRESSDLQDPAARGNAYGILPASGYNGYAMSLAQQKEAFARLYAEYGTQPWAPYDGC